MLLRLFAMDLVSSGWSSAYIMCSPLHLIDSWGSHKYLSAAVYLCVVGGWEPLLVPLKYHSSDDRIKAEERMRRLSQEGKHLGLSPANLMNEVKHPLPEETSYLFNVPFLLFVTCLSRFSLPEASPGSVNLPGHLH